MFHNRICLFFFGLVFGALLFLAAGTCHAAPVTKDTPAISLDRAYPYLCYKAERPFLDLSPADHSTWHGSVGGGVAYVLTSQLAVAGEYRAGLRGDANMVSFQLKLQLKKE